MSRLVRSAGVLAAQVTAEKPRSSWTEVGEPDGLDTIRSIRFSKSAGDWLEPLLVAMMDPRIEGWENGKDGLVVMFTGKNIADYGHPFPLGDAATVADSSSI